MTSVFSCLNARPRGEELDLFSMKNPSSVICRGDTQR